ncbi:lysylphosphatidylglycerol synthase transmembrane domain-containing protein [Chitinophaga vietnamensis]|uniref:lysylphosphatidylglycerol synthase transmembrane domain-containing protein n=1 Tax=Chitinophaga vietnamensis TaxID=2593957 RepID=UPI0011789677|nr:lysylphosphatidylglycerol synthase transmembrane domain-containing protein [Chitinophaga vietnamensis]
MTSSKEKIKPAYWVWSLVFLVFAVVLIVHYFPDIKKEVLLLGKVNGYWLAMAICSQLLTYLFAALVYRLLMKSFPLQRYPPLWEMMKASLISLFFNQAVPSGGISGNTFIFRFLKRFKMHAADRISLIAIELVCYYCALEILIISSLFICIFVYKTPQLFKGVLTGGILIFLLLGALIIFASRKKFIVHLFKKIKQIKFIGKHLSFDFPKSGGREFTFLKTHRRKVMVSVLFQLLMVTADSFTVYALFRGTGISAAPFVVILAFISTRIISILPVSPGSLVLYESSMVFFFVHLGMPAGASVVVTLLYRLLSFWLPMPIGFVLYRREMRRTHRNTKLSPTK